MIEFLKASALIDLYKERIIEEIMSHKDKINTPDDIKTLNNAEFINLITSNIVDSFIKQL
jgi:hypothetical protein